MSEVSSHAHLVTVHAWTWSILGCRGPGDSVDGAGQLGACAAACRLRLHGAGRFAESLRRLRDVSWDAEPDGRLLMARRAPPTRPHRPPPSRWKVPAATRAGSTAPRCHTARARAPRPRGHASLACPPGPTESPASITFAKATSKNLLGSFFFLLGFLSREESNQENGGGKGTSW